ncbi:hypothetical protein [Herbaspirillum rubrisubalbicans]|uniref:Uncharacterized protein n=1 Tax=Herbaspirillum rubrisubalbicans TaxID=80842 RepID=A0ABX9BZF0_9BURK|nr:hypothetical protein [Herbaspirillum rubrisubalbicans]RAM63202.1 hypothetical protein RB24_17965 [Herbaspirillum rubrisubalbicans]
MKKLLQNLLAGARQLLIGSLATAALLAAYAIAGPGEEPTLQDDEAAAIVLTPPLQEQLTALCAAAWPDDEMHAEARRRACAKD